MQWGFLLERLKNFYQVRILAARYSPRYLLGALGAIVLLIGAVFGAVTLRFPPTTFLDILTWIFTVLSLVSAVYSFVIAHREVSDVEKIDSSRHFFFEGGGNVAAGDALYPFFAGIEPSDAEQALGFVKFAHKTGVAHVSDAYDNHLMLRKDMPFQKASAPVPYVSPLPHIRKLQLAYLFYRSRLGKKRMTNDRKVAMLGSIADSRQRLLIGDARYFDSLMTQEAFSARVSCSPVEQIAEKRQILDGLRFYPLAEDGTRLAPLPVAGITSHFGAAAITIGSDGVPLFALQGKENLISGGKVVWRATGSMDYADLNTALGSGRDFRDAVKRNIVREAYEEMGLRKLALPRETVLAELFRRTIVTGFFRTVERAGKPDFIGLLKLPKDWKFDSIDQKELRPIKSFPFALTPIRTVEDFVDLEARLREHDVTLAASSLTALRRMVVIAGYRDSDDEGERAIHATVNRLLGS